MTKNKYGLPREIPASVKLQVRKACGFGCVICGASIIEYEHIDPPFTEAKEHDPENIALLCSQCHAKVTRKFLSKETVKQDRRKPYCKRVTFSREYLDIGKIHPKIIFAGTTLENCQVPVAVGDTFLSEVKEAEEPGGPFRLSANFCNSRGELSLQIVDNEWRASTMNWDVEATGGVITIKDNPRHISLRLVVDSPERVVVDKLDMYLGGLHFFGSPQELVVESPNGRRANYSRNIADHCKVGLLIGAKSFIF